MHRKGATPPARRWTDIPTSLRLETGYQRMTEPRLNSYVRIYKYHGGSPTWTSQRNRPPLPQMPASSYPRGRPAESITDQQRTTGHLMNNGRTPEARFQLPPDHLEITPDVGKRRPYQDVTDPRTATTNNRKHAPTTTNPQVTPVRRTNRAGEK
jgi:hypothetical protein